MAYVDGNSQRTKEIIFKADELQSITMKLPSGVKLHNVTTGKTSKAGEAISEGDGKYVIDADACLDCGTCEGECPTGAIVAGE